MPCGKTAAEKSMRVFESLLVPTPSIPVAIAGRLVVVLLILSAICLVLASMAMPSSYSWMSNAISESAAQGVYCAWVARLGFLLFGFAIVWLASILKPYWARGTYWMHLGFAVFMLSTAAFSHKPWLTELPFDLTEDILHSITATGMGFAFTLGVLVRFFQREKNQTVYKIGDVIAIIIASSLSPLGEIWPGVAGLLQRIIFLVAYCWYSSEALNGWRLPNTLSIARG